MRSPLLRSRPVVPGETILLFYKDYERDSLLPGDRYLKRAVRPLYHLASHKQKVFGFQMWFRLLVNALRREGYDVRINDYAAAESSPRYPVGLAGYPAILEDWPLPNPAILGPGMYDHPSQRPDLFADSRFARYIVTCDWNRQVFEPAYGSQRLTNWFGAIELDQWPDLSGQPKTHDFLIYNKIRWDKERMETELLTPVLQALKARGLAWTELRYNQHDHRDFKKALSTSRALLFLCEHETQGMAYQEAMASGLPVLAWDEGRWKDPAWHRLEVANPIRTSSVPYFDATCGETFQSADDFEVTLEHFQARLAAYRPRAFVQRRLSQTESAELYASAYFSISRAPAELAAVATR